MTAPAPLSATDPQTAGAQRRRFGEPRPARGEAPMRAGEVFFSRTDAQGTILSGNEVFRRVTDYAWEDLIGAPHALTRHPDMPRGMYWLLWNRLSRGAPTGIYLKNRARDGLCYWVFAILTPVDGGYLSVQVKAGADALTRIRREYADLLALEGEKALPPEASGTAFLARLADLGHPGYDGFMAAALAEEMTALSAALKRPANPRLARYLSLTEELGGVERIARDLAASIAAMRSLPTNLQILATRLEPSGGPIGALSSHYASLSAAIEAWNTRFLRDSDSALGCMRAALDNGLFLQGAAELQEAALTQASSERRRGAPGSADATRRDMALLEQQATEFRDKARAGLDRVACEADGLDRALVRMKRLVAELSSTRMLCRIESARRTDGCDPLDRIVSELDAFQSNIDRRLARFGEANRRIQLGAEALRA